jgi:hypothetical protein
MRRSSQAADGTPPWCGLQAHGPSAAHAGVRGLGRAEKVHEIEKQLEDRGRTIALVVTNPLRRVHAEAADGLQKIKKLLDDNVVLNNIIGKGYFDLSAVLPMLS